MAKKKKAPQFGQLPPQFDFFLNPYIDARFTRCPKCDDKTKQRKLPLFIHVFPMQPVALNKTCRYCPSCDLLIAHKDQLEQLIAAICTQFNSDATADNYFVVGTIDRKNWAEGKKFGSIDELRAVVHDFKRYLEFKPAVYTWSK